MFAWFFASGGLVSPAHHAQHLAGHRHAHKVNASSGTFWRLRGLAARAALWRVHSRVTDDEGKPILQALSEQPAAVSELEAVLLDLWSTVKKVRSAGMQTV